MFTWAEDGSHTASDLDASAVVLCLRSYDTAGALVSTRENASDGTYTVRWPGGNLDAFRADDTLATRTLPNGDVETYDTAGLRKTGVAFANGNESAYAYAEDGSFVVTTRDAEDRLFRTASYDALGAFVQQRDDAVDGSYRLTFASGLVEDYRARTARRSLAAPCRVAM